MSPLVRVRAVLMLLAIAVLMLGGNWIRRSMRPVREQPTGDTIATDTIGTDTMAADSSAPGNLAEPWSVIEVGAMGLLLVAAIALLERRTNREANDELINRIKQRTSELARTNKNLEQARLAAEAATRAKSAFLANMSHEIRTPMTAILGYAEQIQAGGLNPQEQHRAAQTICHNGNYLLQIIDDILDLSKVEAGKMQIERFPCELTTLLTDVQSLMQVRAGAKKLSLRFETCGRVPEIIETDPTRLRQILINLIGNAIKFTETGGVLVKARCRPQEGDACHMEFSVEDSGIGMTEETISRLFQPFMQADVSMTRRYGGTGLGLTICKRLAELLGGDIAVESHAGCGTKFRFQIAVRTASATAWSDEGTRVLPMAAPANAKSTTAQQTRNCLQGRILMAEDSPDNQRLIKTVLKNAGAEVTMAENGELAVQIALSAQAEGKPFGVILMDMQMPLLDGYEATARLREAGYTQPIVALTAHALSGDRNLCLESGCDDFLAKPIDREQLLHVVQRWLGSALPAGNEEATSVRK